MVDSTLVWALVGIGLVIAELLSGTFYLLILGIAAFAAAGTAWFGQPFALQVIVATVAAALGVWQVYSYRIRNRARQMPPIDAGQPANLETWVDQPAGLARVRYRGASWEARFDAADTAAQPGALVYVQATDGNTLRVSTRRQS
jgi:membrane protein implicated in regulation of membrane protease activity